MSTHNIRKRKALIDMLDRCESQISEYIQHLQILAEGDPKKIHAVFGYKDDYDDIGYYHSFLKHLQTELEDRLEKSRKRHKELNSKLPLRWQREDVSASQSAEDTCNS